MGAYQARASRCALRGMAAGGICTFLGSRIALCEKIENKKKFVVGTYTEKLGHVDGKGRGLYQYTLDMETGEMNYEGTTPAGDNPSYICACNGMVYAVTESSGLDHGTLRAFQVDGSNLIPKGSVKSAMGPATAYVAVSDDGKFIALANYNGAESENAAENSQSIAIYALNADKTIGDLVSMSMHRLPGSKVVTSRQGEPHPHMARFLTIDGGYAILVPDLGKDKIFTYILSADSSGKHASALKGVVDVKEGAGPRHLEVVDAANPFVYVVNELSSTVDVHKFNVDKKYIGPRVQSVTTLPPGFEAEGKTSTCAAIKAHPTGQCIYVTNRVVNDEGVIAVFERDDKTGLLRARSYHRTGGECPRDIALIGNKMVVCNQDSDSLVSFHILEDGELKPTGKRTQCPSPCVGTALD